MNHFDRVGPWIGLVVFGFLFCSMIFISACTRDSDSPLTGPQAVARGEQVFNYNCGYCHGAKARAPALSELKSLVENERRRAVFNHPVSGEIPQRLSSHDLSDLMEFLESREDPSDQ